MLFGFWNVTSHRLIRSITTAKLSHSDIKKTSV